MYDRLRRFSRHPEERHIRFHRKKRTERPRFGTMFYIWFVSMLVVFLIPLAVSYYVRDRADGLLKAELLSTESTLIETMKTVCDREILSVRQYAAGIAESSEVRAFLAAPAIRTADERLLVKRVFEDIHVEANRPASITDLLLLSLRNSYIISARSGASEANSPLFSYEQHFGCDQETFLETIRNHHSSFLILPGAASEKAQRIFYLRVVTEKSSASPLGYVLVSYSLAGSIPADDGKSVCGLIGADGSVWDLAANQFLSGEESRTLSSAASSAFTAFRGTEYLLSRQRSEVLGLDYFRAVRTDQLFETLFGYQRFYRICLIGCTLVCIALSLIVSRQNYDPVLRLVENLQKTENRKRISDVNFQWIEERYHGLLESHSRLSSQLEQEKHLIVNHLFCRLLKGYYHSAYEIENVFAPHLIEFRKNRFRLILWSADDDLTQTEAVRLPEDISAADLLHDLIAGIARERMEISDGTVWSVDCEGMVFILCNYPAGPEREEADFTAKSREIRSLLQEQLGIQVSWFLSGEYQLATEIPLAYMECIEQMRQCNMPDPPESNLKPAEEAAETAADQDAEKTAEKNRDSDSLAQSVMDYVNAHLYDPDLSLTKIGSAFSLSESYLSRLIRKVFDIQIMAYVNAKRVERVAFLLEHTDSTLNEIALDAGFSSYRTMIRVFEQYHLMTPSQYRKEKRAAGR